ncbi:unnamed protein product [Cyprideis torosa]|uniref:Uncharacterized protein n=1 Tax=Cyprideis torosa TaxID=163714 RepID=A0A7R8W3Z0_9CRUS|nr:unnamed protein product [Cyprideis torosa]CAG0881396.1 unnamed protein product [Cyprideis torosa]
MSWNQGGGGYGDDEGTTEFFVPSDQVGRIIGKGGSRISEIKYESGANINVARESTGNGETQITVRGSDTARNHAKQMIMDIVNQTGGGGGRQGGGGGGRGYGGGGGRY